MESERASEEGGRREEESLRPYACIRRGANACMRTCVCTHAYICLRVRMHACTCHLKNVGHQLKADRSRRPPPPTTSSPQTHTHTHTYIHTPPTLPAPIICLSLSVCVCVYLCVCVCMYIYLAFEALVINMHAKGLPGVAIYTPLQFPVSQRAFTCMSPVPAYANERVRQG